MAPLGATLPVLDVHSPLAGTLACTWTVLLDGPSCAIRRGAFHANNPVYGLVHIVSSDPERVNAHLQQLTAKSYMDPTEFDASH